jgi:hypothetical protein
VFDATFASVVHPNLDGDPTGHEIDAKLTPPLAPPN